MLDLGLRLMHLLGGACRNGALGAWVASLVADADAGASRAGSAAAGEAPGSSLVLRKVASAAVGGSHAPSAQGLGIMQSP